MRDLNHDFKRLAERKRDGAFQTQHDREVILRIVADQFAEGGFLGRRPGDAAGRRGGAEGCPGRLRQLADRTQARRSSSRMVLRTTASMPSAWIACFSASLIRV